jgi:hypothetical protein
MPQRTARPCAPAPNCSGEPRRRALATGDADRDRGGHDTGHRAGAGQCRRSLGRRSSAPVGAQIERAGAPGEGQPHHRAQGFEHDRAYIFQNADRRIVFAIPYERDFTLIGTTDLDYHGDPGTVTITAGEIDYLCAAVNQYFSRQISPHDVVGSYAGVRPLFDDGASEAKAATRDYVLDFDERPDVHLCSTSMAARSPPTGAWPRRCWPASAGTSAPCRARGPAMCPCRAAASR